MARERKESKESSSRNGYFSLCIGQTKGSIMNIKRHREFGREILLILDDSLQGRSGD